MPTPEIIDKVRQLRTELAEAQPDLPQAAHITSAIDSVLNEPAHVPHYVGLRDRLLSATVGIEISHPQLAASFNTVINALNTVGI